ncbi:5-oxoprolinase subunit PxpB [Oceanobacillus kimchii]|uniref:5-oxoprolinase subunit PxpB n=1 Tax=Oceanobacillus TaxID=182709 RepID=UPI0003469C98|nr:MULTISPECIES: 5-oxoprolinase subunit PxpB [Oceanobacillus]MCT1578185.1 5-oxoprolinase subunit PxpB [Oceanobacillus kimchii]MCT2134363.1 5-oxoprolinase subunit PxpB [Oceanobacillus kimchii]OEH55009.1 allophanate hydrolase [Oceanobacillus sp. E9]
MFEVQPYGDRGVRVQFGKSIHKAVNNEIRDFCSVLEKSHIKGVLEWIPTYTAVTIWYDPFEFVYESLEEKILNVREKMNNADISPVRVVHIPVYYGGKKGPDLNEVAQYHGITTEEVVSLHANSDYLIYMMGFIPGFPYLGGMSEKIATPRLEKPRRSIPAGSVGIAGEQTGIYPLESPGGWRIIGQTPISLYNPEDAPPILLKAGDYIRFIPIDRKEFDEITKKVETGSFHPTIET